MLPGRVKRAISWRHWMTATTGHTTRVALQVGSLDPAPSARSLSRLAAIRLIVWIVLPMPISSARIPPRMAVLSWLSPHARNSFWNGSRGITTSSGVAACTGSHLFFTRDSGSMSSSSSPLLRTSTTSTFLALLASLASSRALTLASLARSFAFFASSLAFSFAALASSLAFSFAALASSFSLSLAALASSLALSLASFASSLALSLAALASSFDTACFGVPAPSAAPAASSLGSALAFFGALELGPASVSSAARLGA
mmetsp:Transcript_11583/g.36671  ORF Transcript_11583/g.36671 Transcript_11583/m.36671 type:complete len:258 (+) Transcript_11583:308-1081(+)